MIPVKNKLFEFYLNKNIDEFIQYCIDIKILVGYELREAFDSCTWHRVESWIEQKYQWNVYEAIPLN